MKFLKLAVPVLFAAVLAAPVWAEETKPEAPKTDAPAADAPKADAPKTDAPAADAPKTDAPKTDAPVTEAPKADAPKAADAAPAASESLVGSLHKGAAGKGKKKKSVAETIALTVDAAKVKGAPKEKPKQVTLIATGDILTQLTTLADKSAHVKVTGTVSGDSMTVKEVSEVPAEGKKKKNKA